MARGDRTGRGSSTTSFGSEAHGIESSRTFRGSSAVTGPYRLKKKVRKRAVKKKKKRRVRK